MKIILYQNRAEPQILRKLAYCSIYEELNGIFRDEVDVINPVVRIELPRNTYPNSIIDFNYVFIDELKKYYFIDNKVIVRSAEKLIIDLYLSEDVLTTFQYDISLLNVSVSRQEFKFNNYLHDDLLPCDIRPQYEYGKISITFGDTKGSENYVLSTTSPPILTYKDSSDVLHHTDNHIYPNLGFTNAFVLDQERFMDFVTSMWGKNIKDLVSILFNNPSECIVNLILLPLPVRAAAGVTLTRINGILIGTGDIAISTDAIVETKYLDYEMGTFHITSKYNNFLDYPPYTSIELYLPFYGYLELEPSLVLNKYCQVRYVIDYITGICLIKIIDLTMPSHIIYTVNCQVGIQINLSNTGVTQKLQKIATIGLNVASNVISFAAATKSNKLVGKVTRSEGSTKEYTKFKARVNAERTSRIANFISETTADSVAAMQNHISSGNSSSEIIEWSNFDKISDNELELKIWWRIKRLSPITIENYNRLVGKPAAIYGQIRKFIGYTEVGACHLEKLGYCLNDEVSMIDNELKNGILINPTTTMSKPIIIDNLGNTITPDTNNIFKLRSDVIDYVDISNGGVVMNTYFDNEYELTVIMRNKKIKDISILDNNYNITAKRFYVSADGSFASRKFIISEKNEYPSDYSFKPTITITLE